MTLAELILIRLNMWGKPAEVIRKPREKVRLVKYKEKFLTDRLVLEVPGLGTLKLNLAWNQKEEV